MSTTLIKLVRKLWPNPGLSCAADLESCLKRAAELQISGYYESALVESNRALHLDPANAVAYHRSLARSGLADEKGALADWKIAQRLRIGT